ncbi:hypothetical protein ON010_g9169 [Phytophthora cinnamomi]|nr:hypothetical protein ON010_g9169 [Phytophthora cinnamomi]
MSATTVPRTAAALHTRLPLRDPAAGMNMIIRMLSWRVKDMRNRITMSETAANHIHFMLQKASIDVQSRIAIFASTKRDAVQERLATAEACSLDTTERRLDEVLSMNQRLVVVDRAQRWRVVDVQLTRAQVQQKGAVLVSAYQFLELGDKLVQHPLLVVRAYVLHGPCPVTVTH